MFAVPHPTRDRWRWFPLSEMKLGRGVWRDTSLVTNLDSDSVPRSDWPADGVLGVEKLAEADVVMDFPRRRLELHPRGSLARRPLENPAYRVHLLWSILTVTTRIQDRVCTLVVHTGSGGSYFSSEFAAKLKGLDTSRRAMISTVEGARLMSTLTLPELSLGGYTARGVTFGILEGNPALAVPVSSIDGVIGRDILGHCRLTQREGGKSVRFEPPNRK